MKTILKTFLYGLLFFALSLGFSACDKDDDSDKGPDQEIVEGKWTEQGNKLIYKITYDYGYGVSYSAVWTLTFDGDTCTKSECACTFGSAELADAFYSAWQEDESYPATKSGKTVTVDWTSAHRGMSKTELKNAIGAMDGFE